MMDGSLTAYKAIVLQLRVIKFVLDPLASFIQVHVNPTNILSHVNSMN